MENQFKKREQEKSLKIDKLEKKIDDLLALNLKLKMEKTESLELQTSQTSEPFGDPNNDYNELQRSHRDREVTHEPVKMEPFDTLSSIPYIVVSQECDLENLTPELKLNKETYDHRVAAEEEEVCLRKNMCRTLWCNISIPCVQMLFMLITDYESCNFHYN